MAIKLDTSKFTRNLVKGYKLAPLIERAINESGDLEWKFAFKPKVGDKAFHPSSHCIPSAHELWLEITNQTTRPPLSSSLRKTFAVGHFWHAYLQEICLKADLCDEASIERKFIRQWGDGPFHSAVGSADVAPMRIPGHGEYLVDFKTMGQHDFRINGLPNWCAGKYEAQINIYMDMFDFDQAIILCIQKDSPHDLKEFAFTRNQALIDFVYDKWEYVSRCLRDDKEPDMEVAQIPLKGPV